MSEAGNVAQPSAALVPGVWSSYGNGWRQLWKHFLELFLIVIVSFVIGLPPTIANLAQDLQAFLIQTLRCGVILLEHGHYSQIVEQDGSARLVVQLAMDGQTFFI